MNCCDEFKRCFCGHEPKHECDFAELRRLVGEMFKTLEALSEELEKCCEETHEGEHHETGGHAKGQQK